MAAFCLCTCSTAVKININIVNYMFHWNLRQSVLLQVENIAYLNFQKAFNTVALERLTHALECVTGGRRLVLNVLILSTTYWQ